MTPEERFFMARCLGLSVQEIRDIEKGRKERQQQLEENTMVAEMEPQNNLPQDGKDQDIRGIHRK